MSAEGWFVAAAIASPILSYFGARVSSRSDNRLDRWRRREETMRTIRWAADNAADPDPRVSEVGYAALRGLASSELLQAEDRRFLRLVAEATVSDRVENLPPGVDTRVEEATP